MAVMKAQLLSIVSIAKYQWIQTLIHYFHWVHGLRSKNLFVISLISSKVFTQLTPLTPLSFCSHVISVWPWWAFSLCFKLRLSHSWPECLISFLFCILPYSTCLTQYIFCFFFFMHLWFLSTGMEAPWAQRLFCLSCSLVCAQHLAHSKCSVNIC